MYKKNSISAHNSKNILSNSIEKTRRSPSHKNSFLTPSRYFLKEKTSNAIKFAVSKRPNLFVASENPGPGLYSIPSCFDKGKSYTFSPKFSKSIPKCPGPGQYDVKFIEPTPMRTVFGKEKRKDIFFNKELVGIPDPTKYSYRKNFEGPTWKFGSDKSRKYNVIEDSPGPGAYNANFFGASIEHTFPSSRREEKSLEFPGPGHYTPKAPNNSSFYISKADKSQKIVGPILPGPSDYFIGDKNTSFTQSQKSSFIINYNN